MCLFLLKVPVQSPEEAKETADMLVQGSAVVILTFSVIAWFVAWRYFRIEPRGKKYFLIHAAIAVIYLPFLIRFFFRCYDMNFSTGKEHYLLLFFVHSALLLFSSLAFYGRNKQEESY